MVLGLGLSFGPKTALQLEAPVYDLLLSYFERSGFTSSASGDCIYKVEGLWEGLQVKGLQAYK